MSNYPEHEKLGKISDKSQAIGKFIDWLANTKGYHLAYWVDAEEPQYGEDEQRLVYIPAPITKLLAEFFEIDENRIEDEKRTMLDEMRKANA